MEYNFKMIFVQIKNNYIVKKYIEKIDIYKNLLYISMYLYNT